ncbi:uncharacterized protein PHACADRAFT_189481 [Phanerochaete carnosa HHB-10118-sp]|uniref:Peptidase A1 domain-containing protein n=1 Tax=Phanerochaete carnosa (strain HHB-10118-sp) TaxID=650164 RepID=K5WMF6_PHACS|nr:uncharacterized protein PHACADRAFT_189481 [Phanerochaete carnosa HHB-10118-sp]EKM60349.1 hypothetical protein PHACADRAFT_189481 [Phanerochaete carnosa HHB-10118-sp]
MFCKATLIPVTLALLTTTSSIVHAPGVKVALEERSTLTRADRTFDHENVILDGIKIQNKYQRNLRNLLANTDSLPKGWEIKDFITVSSSSEKHAVGIEALANDKNVEWLGPITIGTPNQPFNIQIDTGSPNLWIPSSSCANPLCNGKSKYNASALSTSSQKNGTFIISYGDNSTVSGPIYTDTVIITGLTTTDQYFSSVTIVSASFGKHPSDGILGLSYGSLSCLGGVYPFFNTLINQKKVSMGKFGFTLGSVSSELYLGGTDTSKYTGSIEYHDVVTLTGLWMATGAKSLVGLTTMSSGFNMIIDSGKTYMYALQAMVSAFYVAIQGSFIFKSKTWEVTNANFNRGETSMGSSQCVGALIATSKGLGLGDNTWLLGDAFMKNVYTTFSFN